METLFQVFVSEELHGLEHQTALLEYLDSYSELRERAGFETIPDQLTLHSYSTSASHLSA